MTQRLQWLLALSGCGPLYREARDGVGPFDERILRALDVTVRSTTVDCLPERGPVVIVANHPHGIVDGLALASLVRQRRADVRIVANRLLSCVPELDELCFFVDPNEGPAAAAHSLAGLRAAHLWLRRGGVLIMFPSGEVAHTRASDGGYEESPWRDTASRLAIGTGATMARATIDGHNSRLFYTAGRVHPALRTALLAREFLRKKGSTIDVRFDVDTVAGEIAALPADACLIREGDLRVFCVRAPAIPATLHEIGRLRAVTYAAAGEGTGRAIDLDDFDQRYLHLFAWDDRAQRVVGAYRVGESDTIADASGVHGLYTRTLFRYDRRLLERMGPALELGRSFIRQEYQRSYSALLLLWKGIGRFVARHPHYRVLFGPVSVSSRRPERSRQQLMAYLRTHHLDRELAQLVEATTPAREDQTVDVPRSLKELDVPVLLRQYLTLNARLVGFNVDPAFSDALDALMIVDLATVDERLLKRCFGADAASSFLARHHIRPAA